MRKVAKATVTVASPSPSRRERHRAETRERIFRAALNLFAERGFLETTVEDITDTADVGKGTFFNYFPTKEHVLATYGAERLATVQFALKKAKSADGPVLPILRDLLTGLAGQSSANPALLRAIYAAHATCAPVRAELEARLHQARAFLSEIFALAQKRGEVRTDLNTASLARSTQIVFQGVALAWAFNPDSSLAETTENVWELFCPGLQAGVEAVSNRTAGSAVSISGRLPRIATKE
jgi:AcrR family transcriptional regulator